MFENSSLMEIYKCSQIYQKVKKYTKYFIFLPYHKICINPNDNKLINFYFNKIPLEKLQMLIFQYGVSIRDYYKDALFNKRKIKYSLKDLDNFLYFTDAFHNLLNYVFKFNNLNQNEKWNLLLSLLNLANFYNYENFKNITKEFDKFIETLAPFIDEIIKLTFFSEKFKM